MLETNDYMVAKNRRHPRLIGLFYLCLALAILAGQSTQISQAQGSDEWAPPKPIPLYYDIFPPIMVADRNQTVHAFNSQSIEMGVFAIYYRTWRVGLGWSPPNDILLPEPSGSAQDVLLDDEGKFHLVFYKGEEEIGTILYTTAWATQASIAQAWSTPVEIATIAGPLDNAVLAGDGKGKMYVVFVGQKEGIGIYEVHSEDGGQSWSQSQALQVVRERTRFPTHIDLVLDSQANLHAVWAVLDDNGLGTKVFYA